MHQLSDRGSLAKAFRDSFVRDAMHDVTRMVHSIFCVWMFSVKLIDFCVLLYELEKKFVLALDDAFHESTAKIKIIIMVLSSAEAILSLVRRSIVRDKWDTNLKANVRSWKSASSLQSLALSKSLVEIHEGHQIHLAQAAAIAFQCDRMVSRYRLFVCGCFPSN